MREIYRFCNRLSPNHLGSRWIQKKLSHNLHLDKFNKVKCRINNRLNTRWSWGRCITLKILGRLHQLQGLSIIIKETPAKIMTIQFRLIELRNNFSRRTEPFHTTSKSKVLSIYTSHHRAPSWPSHQSIINSKTKCKFNKRPNTNLKLLTTTGISLDSKVPL